MRAYTFINSYICGIQVGIQAGHAIVELMNESKWTHGEMLPRECEHAQIVESWADEHKTFVWLDGGDAEAMDDLHYNIGNSSLPYAVFKEPGLGLDVVTSIALVTTPEVQDAIDKIREYRGRVFIQESEVSHDCWIVSEDDSYVTDVMNRPDLELALFIANARRKSL